MRKGWMDACDAYLAGKSTKPENEPFLTDRRAILAGMLAAPFAAAAQNSEENPTSLNTKVDALSGATVKQWIHQSLDELKGPLPKGKLGNLEISRLIFGSNLIGGFSHSRDLIYVSDLLKAYFTEAKVFETLFLAEQASIDTMITPSFELPLIKKYHEVANGAIQTIVQTFIKPEDPTSDADKAIDNGGTTLYIQGGVADRLIQEGKIDTIHAAVRHIQDQHYLAGVGGHSIETIKKCEEMGIGADYYVKTCHHDHYWSAHPRERRVEFSIVGPCQPDHNDYHDNIFDLFPEETVAFMETVTKPWIGFKVLAGGAIHPRDGFKYAYSNGADFVCAGIFDFQLVDDVNIALETLNNLGERKRPWRA
jgi:hypothetical protein